MLAESWLVKNLKSIQSETRQSKNASDSETRPKLWKRPVSVLQHNVQVNAEDSPAHTGGHLGSHQWVCWLSHKKANRLNGGKCGDVILVTIRILSRNYNYNNQHLNKTEVVSTWCGSSESSWAEFKTLVLITQGKQQNRGGCVMNIDQRTETQRTRRVFFCLLRRTSKSELNGCFCRTYIIIYL